jgi:hypothetical protein
LELFNFIGRSETYGQMFNKRRCRAFAQLPPSTSWAGMGRPRVADLALARAADPAEIGVLRAYKLLFHNISYANGGM